MTLYYGVSVARQDVKRIKTHLEQDGLRHKTLNITHDANGEHGQRMIIPTSITASDEPEPAALRALGCPLVHIEGSTAPDTDGSNALTRAFKTAAGQLPEHFWSTHVLTPAGVFSDWKPSSIIYEPMLLLRSKMLSHAPFATFLTALEAPSTPSPDRTAFWASVAHAMGVTHIALDAPIPAATDTTSNQLNALRSPLNFRPLHGSFGPLAPRNPTATDFASALWVRTTQNSLIQTWSPLHTMFSAGNVGEKARILRLPSVARVVADAPPTAAADLFAGIGYFAFSYAAAGVDVVLAWDLNPWSCEALRRGAAANGFGCATLPGAGLAPDASDAALAQSVLPRARLLVANESNAHAGGRVRALRRAGALPAVRHVNCGMLPSADFAWRNACEVLDPLVGGWLHLHESVRVEGVGARAEEIRGAVEAYVRGIAWGVEIGVEVVEVVKVKSIAPRTVHVVVDLFVPGCGREEWDVPERDGGSS